MRCPGPISRARRTAPAILIPEVPPRQSPSYFKQIEYIRQRLGIGDAISVIDLQPLDILGDPPLPDAFGDRRPLRGQFAGGEITVKRRPFRISQGDPHVFFARSQSLAYAGKRAARSDRGNKTVNSSARLFPDFRRRGLEMRPFVGHVVELVGPDNTVFFGLGHLFGQSLGVADEVVRISIRHRRNLDQRGADQSQRVFLFLTLGLGDNDDGFIAHRRADQRQTDPGVACRALDDGSARPELA